MAEYFSVLGATAVIVPDFKTLEELAELRAKWSEYLHEIKPIAVEVLSFSWVEVPINADADTPPRVVLLPPGISIETARAIIDATNADTPAIVDAE